ncbi:MAG: hypothetical protein WCO60_20075 [Verrucomicrobiota bacterium]
MPEYINLTPHVIRLNDGTEFPPSGVVARVLTGMFPVEITEAESGEPTIYDVKHQLCDLDGPLPEGDGRPRRFIVSPLVLETMKKRAAGMPKELTWVAPATGHPATVRKDGQVFSVPGFVR